MPSPADSPRALDDRSSDVGDAHHEPHQAEQDAHLAASLSQAPRLRSGTVSRNTTEDLPGSTEAGGAGGQQQPSQAAAGPSTQTPVAQRTSSNNVTFGASAGTGSESRRRPSLGHTRSGESASDAMGHLADDLAREDREEEARIAQERQYDREAAAVAAVRARRQQHSHHAHPYHGTPSSMPRSAVAARLYRQQNLSDSSIDSNGGAFIDHRRQQHSLSIGTSPRAAAGPGNSSTRSPELVPIGSSARKGSSGLRRYSSSAGAGDDSLARSPTSPRAFDPAMAPRGYSVSPSEANGPDASGEHDRSRPVHFLERHSSHGSMRSRRSDRSSGSGGHRSRDLPYGVDMSRPGSGLGKPEDDICFPAHGAAAELDFIDMRDVDHPHDSDHHHGHPGDGFADPEGAVPLPGVLPNFPFPFDFTALEDFAEHEREGMPIPNGRRRRAAGDLAQSMSPPTAANEYGVSSPTMTENRYQSHTNFGKHDSESQGGGGGTGMGGGRRRRMSGNQHGRMRRKLALFEGAGDDLDDVSSPPSGGGGARPFNGRGDSDYANLNGTKTPLLADKRGASGYGAAAGPDARKAGGARPYRFSFYSNALPTTVHARSLAELPSDGQSFEELFCGTRHRAEYDGGDEPATQNRPPSAVSLDARLAGLAASTTDQKAGSGTATPASAANTVNNVPSSKLLGTLPAGVSATTMRTDRPKTVVMRSDEDAEANTWWLDVTCPTDQEMKTLSKVRSYDGSPVPSLADTVPRLSAGLWYPPAHDRGYPNGGDARKDRALPELLLCLLPVLRARPVLADVPRAAQHVHYRLPGGDPVGMSSKPDAANSGGPLN